LVLRLPLLSRLVERFDPTPQNLSVVPELLDPWVEKSVV
jgi:hypothetical protein